MTSTSPYMLARPVLVLALCATAAAAQERPAAQPRAWDDAWARYAPELARLQTQIALLRRQTMALANRPSREADSVLAVLEPRWREVGARLQQIEFEIGRDGERRTMDARSVRRLSTMSDSLQRRVLVRLGEALGNAPTGYMGVGLVGASRDRDPWTKQYLQYPVVRTVDPGSPAARAGLLPGDTVVAYDGADVKARPVELRRLLRPGATVNVRLRRAGRTREVAMVIARRQNGAAHVYGWTDESEPATDWTKGAPPPPLPTAPVAPSPPPAGFVYVYGGPGRNDLVAGAEMVRVTPELGEPFGVERGLLVLSVAANSPAARSGLRGGDVIVRVNGDEVVLPVALRRAVDRAEENVVELEVVRRKRKQAVRLTW